MKKEYRSHLDLEPGSECHLTYYTSNDIAAYLGLKQMRMCDTKYGHPIGNVSCSRLEELVNGKWISVDSDEYKIYRNSIHEELHRRLGLAAH